jgi:hypothetical protein
LSIPGLYLDEDLQSTALITALRARGLSVRTTTEAGMSNHTDREQLEYATHHLLVLVSSNVADFARLHSDWLHAGKHHPGVILIHQQKWGPGELARRIIRLLAAVPEGGFNNRLEFLSNW